MDIFDVVFVRVCKARCDSERVFFCVCRAISMCVFVCECLFLVCMSFLKVKGFRVDELGVCVV